MPRLNLEQVAELYADGATIAELAGRFGLSQETMRRRMAEAKIPRRRRGPPVGKYRPADALTLDSLPPKAEGRPYYIHCDPGLKKDAFTLALCHTTEDYRTIETAKGEREQLQRVVVDFVISWDPRYPRVVDYLNVRAVLKQLVQFYDVKRVTFDRWNSVEGIQELVAMGVDADDMSFSNAEQLAMYRYLRLAFYNDMITLAPGDEKTQLELKFVRQKGNEIVHDLYGKDRADAVAAVVWNAARRAEGPAHRHSPRAPGGSTPGPAPTCSRRG